MVKITADTSGWVVWPKLCVCYYVCLIFMLCLDVWGDILSPPVFGVVSTCGRCVVGEGDERRDKESPVCVFITGVFAILCPLRDWLKETIFARLFLGRKGLLRPTALSTFCREQCCDCHVYADHFLLWYWNILGKLTGQREVRNDVMAVLPWIPC